MLYFRYLVIARRALPDEAIPLFLEIASVASLPRNDMKVKEKP